LLRLEAKTLQSKLSSKQFDFAQLFWLAPYDSPCSLVDRFYHKNQPKNFSSFQSEKLSQLIEELELSNQREATLFKIETLFSDTIPFIPLNNWAYPYYISPKIDSLCFTNLGTINFTFIKINKDT
jgi:ABC-type transport system substrate-binding protein